MSSNKNSKQLRFNLKKRRLAANLSQMEVSTKSGVSQPYISLLEKYPKLKVGKEVRQKLCHLFGMKK